MITVDASNHIVWAKYVERKHHTHRIDQVLTLTLTHHPHLPTTVDNGIWAETDPCSVCMMSTASTVFAGRGPSNPRVIFYLVPGYKGYDAALAHHIKMVLVTISIGISICICIPGMYNMHFVFSGMLLSGARVFFLALSAAG